MTIVEKVAKELKSIDVYNNMELSTKVKELYREYFNGIICVPVIIEELPKYTFGNVAFCREVGEKLFFAYRISFDVEKIFKRYVGGYLELSSTIIHELIHYFLGGKGLSYEEIKTELKQHDETFIKIAKRYGVLHLERYETSKERKERLGQYCYFVKCENCGKLHLVAKNGKKLSDFIKDYPSWYRDDITGLHCDCTPVGEKLRFIVDCGRSNKFYYKFTNMEVSFVDNKNSLLYKAMKEDFKDSIKVAEVL